jgi:hypothetical protein
MHVDELESALRSLAADQPAVTDRLTEIETRVSRHRLRIASGSVALTALCAAGVIWYARPEGQITTIGTTPPSTEAAGVVATVPPTGEPQVTAAPTVGGTGDPEEVDCGASNPRRAEVMPIPGGAATPEAELQASLSRGWAMLPQSGYTRAAASGSRPGTSAPRQVFVHRSVAGRVDVELTLFQMHDGGWRVEGAIFCPA